jgi:hypothetical protein
MRRRRDFVREDIGVRRGDHLLYSHVVSQPRRQSDGPFARCSKRHSKPTFTRLPDSTHDVPTTTVWYMTIISKTGPKIVVGLLELRVLRQNPPVGSALPRPNRAKDKAIQRVTSSWCYLGPHRGDPASSSFVFESRLGGFLHAPLCALASSCPGSPDRDYSGTTHETMWPGLHRGTFAPIWSYGEVLAHVGSHPRTMTQTPLRS